MGIQAFETIETGDVIETVQAVYPRRVLPIPVAPESASRAAFDMPSEVYAIWVGCWAVLIGIFADTFSGDHHAMFQLAVVVFYAVMFFGVPVAIARMAPSSQCKLSDFLDSRFQCYTGGLSAKEVLIQVLMVPVALSLGAACISYIVHAARLAAHY